MTIEDILASNDPWKVASETFLRLISKVADTPEACSEAEWIIFRVWSLLGEVSNGGFDQFFFNSSGNHAAVTPDALRAIGDDQAIRILEEAMAVFPEAVSPDRDVRWAQMDRLSKEMRAKFEPLDRRLWECSPRVIERLAVYIRSHAAEIQPG
jgi:hypothetical protein